MVSADAFAPAGGAAIEMGVTTSANATTSIDRSRGEKMHYAFIVLLVLLCSVSSAAAQVSIAIGPPSVSIGINLPSQDPVVRQVYQQHGPQGRGEGQEKSQGHKK